MRLLLSIVAVVFFIVLVAFPAFAMEAPVIALASLIEENSGLVLGISQDTSQLEMVLDYQNPGNVFLNPLKHAIRLAVEHEISLGTIVLLLLLPLVATTIALAHHLIGLRGFGIFLPAALSVVFLAIGPVLGIGLFLVIVAISTSVRIFLKKTQLRLQYLARMALILWWVVLGILGILFLSPVIKEVDLTTVSIFPVLILALLAEDFTRVQVGKSMGVAVALTSETLMLSIVSYAVLSLRPVQYFAILNPELLLLSVLALNIFIGRYVGLRLMEVWRFRKLIKS